MDEKEELKERIKKLKLKYGGLLNMLDMDFDVDDFAEYMSTPILTLEISRYNTSVKGGNCDLEDIEQAVTNGISHLLDLLPANKRNEVVAKAILCCDKNNEEGKLKDYEKTI